MAFVRTYYALISADKLSGLCFIFVKSICVLNFTSLMSWGNLSVFADD